MYVNFGTTTEKKDHMAEEDLRQGQIRITEGLENALRQGSWKSTLLPLGFAFGVLVMIVAVAVFSN